MFKAIEMNHFINVFCFSGRSKASISMMSRGKFYLWGSIVFLLVLVFLYLTPESYDVKLERLKVCVNVYNSLSDSFVSIIYPHINLDGNTRLS